MSDLSKRQRQIVGLMSTLPPDRGPLIPIITRQLGVASGEATRELVDLYVKGAIRLGAGGFYAPSQTN